MVLSISSLMLQVFDGEIESWCVCVCVWVNVFDLGFNLRVLYIQRQIKILYLFSTTVNIASH